MSHLNGPESSTAGVPLTHYRHTQPSKSAQWPHDVLLSSLEVVRSRTRLLKWEPKVRPKRAMPAYASV